MRGRGLITEKETTDAAEETTAGLPLKKLWVVLEIKGDDDLARQLWILKQLELRVPVGLVVAGVEDQLFRLDQTLRLRLNLNRRLSLIDRRLTIHLHRHERCVHHHQAQDQQLAFENYSQVVAQMRRLRLGHTIIFFRLGQIG